MERNDFIEKFAIQFEETNASEFQARTPFKKLEEWSSLTALSIIAMVDEEYHVKLTGEDIRNAKTIEDVFRIVSSRIA